MDAKRWAAVFIYLLCSSYVGTAVGCQPNEKMEQVFNRCFENVRTQLAGETFTLQDENAGNVQMTGGSVSGLQNCRITPPLRCACVGDVVRIFINLSFIDVTVTFVVTLLDGKRPFVHYYIHSFYGIYMFHVCEKVRGHLYIQGDSEVQSSFKISIIPKRMKSGRVNLEFTVRAQFASLKLVNCLSPRERERERVPEHLFWMRVEISSSLFAHAPTVICLPVYGACPQFRLISIGPLSALFDLIGRRTNLNNTRAL
ncbi:hypothetical protein AVEN_120516-1 [Araneus ventricosus]|uniref:Uncharacterized protein n=1 Tax=Araneus ventricosus TaxID=182803 RepID=A0A4Y2MNU8_ARAVE|nr:hypothetical protein AVEN_120516-1 [Araneus ventricosus]